jgi:hypothetical protein
MAHFAELDENNFVLRVIVVNNENCLDESDQESESVGIVFCQSLFGQNTRWVQTSYNASFRRMYAGEGFYYDANLDVFVEPKPDDSWSYNAEIGAWFDPDIVLGGAIYEQVQSAVIPTDEDILAQMQASKGE